MATIGSKSWKSKGFKRLINYINSDKGKMDEDKSFPPIYHNISGHSLEDAIVAMREADEKRLVRRKDSITMYSEFLSFHVKDRPSIKTLEDLSRKWIELRSLGRQCLCFARAHLKGKALHVHFAFSGVDLQGKALRLSNRDFLRIRKQHERYQVEKYPGLKHSIVYLDKERFKMLPKEKADQQKRTQKEFARKKRTSKKSSKELANELVLDSLENSPSFTGFVDTIRSQQADLYFRGKRFEGIVFQGRKYRFRTLGLDVRQLRMIEANRKDIELYQNRVREMTRSRNERLEQSKSEHERN